MECYECQLEFEEPHRLPRILTTCGHTLCHSCVSTLLVSNSVICPQCNTKNPATSVNSFPANIALIQLKQKPAQDLCEIHGKSLEAYCNNDHKVLCVSCILDSGHKSHDISSISKAAGKQREILSNLALSALQNEQGLLKEEQELENLTKISYENYEKVLKEFSGLYEAIREALIARESEMVARMKTTLDEDLAIIDERHKQNKKQACLIQSFKSELERAESENDLELISRFKNREAVAKQACSKLQNFSKSDAFSQFSREIEANFFWKLIKQVFAYAPKSKIQPKKNEEKVPLALANAAFSKDLRGNAKPVVENEKKGGKKEVKQRPATVKPTQKKPKMIGKPKESSAGQTPHDDGLFEWNDDFSGFNKPPDEFAFSMKSFDLASLYKAPQANIYTLGGFSDKGLVSLECYNCTTNSSDFLADSLTSRTQFGAISLNNSILMIGGKHAGKRISSSEEYNVHTNEWLLSDITLTSPRSGFAAMSISNDIYVLGGSDGVPLRVFECFNDRGWNSLPPMKQRRDETAGTVGPDLQIYSIGGYGGGEMMCLNSSERFSMETNSWEEIPSMQIPRRALSAVTLPDGIYAIGGYDGGKYLKTLEKFDIRMGKWINLASMKHARCTLSAVVSPDCQFIYAIGGFNGSALSVVERYSVVEDKWTELLPLQNPRFMHSSVLISD